MDHSCPKTKNLTTPLLKTPYWFFGTSALHIKMHRVAHLQRARSPLGRDRKKSARSPILIFVIVWQTTSANEAAALLLLLLLLQQWKQQRQLLWLEPRPAATQSFPNLRRPWRPWPCAAHSALQRLQWSGDKTQTSTTRPTKFMMSIIMHAHCKYLAFTICMHDTAVGNVT